MSHLPGVSLLSILHVGTAAVAEVAGGLLSRKVGSHSGLPEGSHVGRRDRKCTEL